MEKQRILIGSWSIPWPFKALLCCVLLLYVSAAILVLWQAGMISSWIGYMLLAVLAVVIVLAAIGGAVFPLEEGTVWLRRSPTRWKYRSKSVHVRDRDDKIMFANIILSRTR